MCGQALQQHVVGKLGGRDAHRLCPPRHAFIQRWFVIRRVGKREDTAKVMDEVGQGIARVGRERVREDRGPHLRPPQLRDLRFKRQLGERSVGRAGTEGVQGELVPHYRARRPAQNLYADATTGCVGGADA